MYCNRIVKVAVLDQSFPVNSSSKESVWHQISKSLLGEYVFPFPKVLNKLSNSDGSTINISPLLVKDSPALLSYKIIGSDPYQHIFLYIYVISVRSNEDLTDKDIDNMIHWMETAKMTGNKFMILIIQIEKSRFSTQKVINKSLISTDNEDLKRIFIIPYRNKQGINESTILSIQEQVKDEIIEEFQTYLGDAENYIRSHDKKLSISIHYRVWISLLLFSFGFLDAAETNALESYKIIEETQNPKLSELLKPIDAEKITSFPLTENKDIAEILSCAVHGLMAIYYSKGKYKKIVTIFFRHFAYLSRISVDKDEVDSVRNWAELSLINLSSISAFDNTPDVRRKILFALFMIAFQRNDPKITNIYSQLSQLTSNSLPYLSTAIHDLYITWEGRNNVPIINPDISSSYHFDIGIRALETQFDSFLNKKEFTKAADAGWALISSRSKYDKRLEIFNKLAQLDSIHLNKSNLFPLHMNLNLDVFKQVLHAGEPATFQLFVSYPKWLDIHFEKAILLFRHRSEPKLVEMMIEYPNLKKKLVFHSFFPVSGLWYPSKFYLKKGAIMLTWNIDSDSNLSYNLNIHPHPRPIYTMKISRHLMEFKFDFSQVVTNAISLKFEFDNKQITIPNQNGTSYISETKSIDYSITDGQVIFSEPPSLQIVPFQVKFWKEEGVECCNLRIKTTFDSQSYIDIKKVNFTFPLKLSFRLIKDDICHIQLINKSSTPLCVSIDSRINERSLDINESFFLICKTNDHISVKFKDELNEVFEQVLELENLPKAELIPLRFPNRCNRLNVGNPVQVKCILPECEFSFIPNKKIVLFGITRVNRFRGGAFAFGIIPTTTGVVKLPKIVINGVKKGFSPKYVIASAVNVLLYGPFMNSQKPLREESSEQLPTVFSEDYFEIPNT